MSKNGSEKQPFWLRMVERPKHIGKTNALLLGIAWLIICAILGWHFRLVPISSCGFTVSGYVSLSWMLIYNIIIWVVSCLLLFALAVLRKRSTGALETFARLLYARWPATLLMIPAMFESQRIAYATFMSEPSLCFEQTPVFAALMAIIWTIVMAWYFYWSYLAFCRAQQKSGVITFLLFVVGFGLSYLLSKIVMNQIYTLM